MGVFFYLLFYFQSFDICGRVSAIRKALVMLCSSQVSQAVTVMLRNMIAFPLHKCFYFPVSFRIMVWGQAVSSAAKQATSVQFVSLISESP